jgi:pimeloyl-ACP methyl ester carboxylesterase
LLADGSKHRDEPILIRNIFADYVEINPKAEKTLLFVHGWPSLWASWKYQIQEFQVVIDSYYIPFMN